MKYSLMMVAIASSVACSSSQPASSTEAKPDEQAQAASGNANAEHAKEEAKHAEASEERKPLKVQEDGAELYGAEFDGEREVVALATIVESAKSYDGKVVRTEGTITQVCKKMGCWIEVSAEGAEEVRVPMAGHSYFLPESVQGKKATLEGKIEVKPLSEEMKKHLADEGAKATENEVSLSATTVLVHAAEAPQGS